MPSAIRGGRTPDGFLSLADFDWKTHDDGQPATLTCPQGQVIDVEPGRADQRFIARADAATCDACPLLAICPLRPQGSQRTPGLYFHLRTFQVAQKRQQVTTSGPAGNLRAAVKATVRSEARPKGSVKHPFRHSKVPVCGRFRVACVILASALMVNVRRLHQLVTRTQLDPHRSDLHSTHGGPIDRLLALFPTFIDILTSRSLRLVHPALCLVPTPR